MFSEKYKNYLKSNEETVSAIFQILEKENNRQRIYISRLMQEDYEDHGFWVNERIDIPDWLPIGEAFEIELMKKIKTKIDFIESHFAIKEYKFLVSPYETKEDADHYFGQIFNEN